MNLPPFLLERYFAEHEFSAKYVLCSSDCETLTTKELISYDPLLLDRIVNFSIAYSETIGGYELRSEIAKQYKDFTAEDIIVFSGAQEGIFLISHSVIKSGDHIIVQSPCYQSLYQVSESLGAEVSFWQMNFNDGGWMLNMDILESLIKPNTKAIILNTPHNPTGYSLKSTELADIVKMLEGKNIYLLIDEVYRYLEYNGSTTLRPAAELSPMGVSLGVMSKTFGLPGLRIGWMATKDKALLRKVALNKDYTTLCNSSLSEMISISALQNKEKIIRRNLNIINNNIVYLMAFFKKYGDIFSYYKPTAGSTCFPKFRIKINSKSFCDDFVKSKGVFVLPGEAYGINAGHFRIGFGKKNMEQCLIELDNYLIENFY